MTGMNNITPLNTKNDFPDPYDTEIIFPMGTQKSAVRTDNAYMNRDLEKIQDGFIDLMEDELIYHDYMHTDMALEKIKAERTITAENFSLQEVLIICAAEEKDWEEIEETYARTYQSWNIRKALGERATAYFNANNRASYADIRISKSADGLNAQVINTPAKNSYRVYRNNLDIYCINIQSYAFEKESVRAAEDAIRAYMDYLQLIHERKGVSITIEDFEFTREIILQQIYSYYSHWQDKMQWAYKDSSEAGVKQAYENMLLFQCLSEKIREQPIPKKRRS
jgi:hypothetical protein